MQLFATAQKLWNKARSIKKGALLDGALPSGSLCLASRPSSQDSRCSHLFSWVPSETFSADETQPS